jgi:threonine synthase
VDGSFDDCQRIVKTLFADLDFKNMLSLGAVNSINWARILAQIVYYFHLWAQMPAKEITFAVPTGNFGNIFAGYCAKRMGLPIKKLILATNSNDILHRFVSNGDYSVNQVVPTTSPAMDIQLASNFERYLYYLYGEDAARLKTAMRDLQYTGRINFSEEERATVQADFSSWAADDAAIKDTIRTVYEKDNFVIDPHTACAVRAVMELGADPESTVCLATAHPAKFGDVVKDALGFSPEEPAGLAAVHGLSSRTINSRADIDEIKRILMAIFV